MTDPYVYRLAAPSENGDGTNTLKAPLFETSRTRVVGLQGRRRDLPTTNLPDRTEILITTGGRAQCPQCPKTFVRKEHARRHLLLHTGERPYVCPLCTRAFTRSDVLKGHFQKCSLRRGGNWGQALIPPAGPQA
ncbi:C2H2 type master regulator of conidiophore development [Trichophyton mentagrophytes]|nr:C2H2 type master regulator of conidiophore development [Trichophyton mentagrophytes]